MPIDIEIKDVILLLSQHFYRRGEMNDDSKCPNCYNYIKPTQNICGNCGTILSILPKDVGSLFCDFCGAEVSRKEKVCPQCKTELPEITDEMPHAQSLKTEITEKDLKEAAETTRTGSVAKSLMLGFIGLLSSALFWGITGIITGQKPIWLPLICGAFIGWLVFLGGWQGRKSQVFSLLLLLGSIPLGEFIYFSVSLKKFNMLYLFPSYVKETTGWIDFIFFSIGSMESWIVPKQLALKSILNTVKEKNSGVIPVRLHKFEK